MGASTFGTGLVIWGLVKESWKEQRFLTAVVILGTAVEVFCTLGLLLYDESLSHAQDTKIIALGITVNDQAGKLHDAAVDAGLAKSRAGAATASAGQALSNAAHASNEASSAVGEANAAHSTAVLVENRLAHSEARISCDEKRAEWRDLSDEQIRKVAAKLQTYPNTPFDLAMQTDLEPMTLLDKVEGAMLLAGWKELSPDPRGPSFNRGNKPPVGERTMAGVWVLSAPEFGEQRHALVLALNAEGIVTPEHIITGDDPEDHRGVMVWVGVKPPIESPACRTLR